MDLEPISFDASLCFGVEINDETDPGPTFEHINSPNIDNMGSLGVKVQS